MRQTSQHIQSGASYFHYYIRDHQGNNRVVAKYDGTIEQTTHYYPYGGILSQSTNQGVQKYKYICKELDRMHGLDMYDFGARQQDPETGMFTSMDPMCEKYYNISPYMYCAGNPIRYVDPDGRDAVPIIDKENKTITIKADYYVNTHGVTKGDRVVCAGYSLHDIENMNNLVSTINSQKYKITEGQYLDYSVVFDLKFIDGGNHQSCAGKASADYFSTSEGDIPIGNVMERNDDIHDGDLIKKDDVTYVGGYTRGQSLVVMNAGRDSNDNKLDTNKARLHELFHTFGFSDMPGSKGIMDYSTLKINQADINSILETLNKLNNQLY